MNSTTGNIGNVTSAKAPSESERGLDRFKIHTMRDSRDTADLRYGVWQRRASPRRWVVFLNGRSEWIEKYSYLPEDLGLPDDCGFLTWDHRGQGASGGARAYIDSYDTYAQDAAAIVKAVVGDSSYVVMAHSMGGLISLYATLKGMLKPQALVLSSPLLAFPNVPVPAPIAKPLSRLLTHCRLGSVSSGGGTYTRIPFELNNLTHHVERYKKMQANPYPIPGATFGWVAATFAALDFCYESRALSQLKAPTLVLGGSNETVVDRSGFHKWVLAASEQHGSGLGAEIQLRMIPDAKHELFSEIPEYYQPAVAAVRQWFKDAIYDGRTQS